MATALSGQQLHQQLGLLAIALFGDGSDQTSIKHHLAKGARGTSLAPTAWPLSFIRRQCFCRTAAINHGKLIPAEDVELR